MPDIFRAQALGDLEGALTAGQEALEIAATLGAPALRARASYRVGQAYWNLGDFGRAAAVLRENVEALAQSTSGPLPLSGIDSQAWLAMALSELGAFAEGRRYGEEALRLALRERQGDGPIKMYGCLGYLYLAKGDLEVAIRMLDQGLALGRASGDRNWARMIAVDLGEAYARAGRLTEGLTLLEEVCSDDIRRGAPLAYVRNLRQLSVGELLAGRLDAAWQHADQALDLARQLQARGFEALTLCQLGAVHAHAAPPNVEQVEACYRQALTLAEELSMRPLQAHCHRGLGTLYAATGQREQARVELAAAIELYRDMEMTFWLPQAEATLAQVV